MILGTLAFRGNKYRIRQSGEGQLVEVKLGSVWRFLASEGGARDVIQEWERRRREFKWPDHKRKWRNH